MRTTLLAVALASQLAGCFAVIPIPIPGAIAGRIGDAMTGAEGEHCVRVDAAPGDVLTGPAGRAVVVSVSGLSSRCTDPAKPVRARLQFGEKQLDGLRLTL
jgi:hypothetical protein